MGIKKTFLLIVAAAVVAVLFFSCKNPSAQETAPVKPDKVRMARLVIDSAQLEQYKILLKEEIDSSMKKEPGVLALYAVFDKKQPTHLTILELYASEEAYQLHIKTPHFLKYKQGSAAMVKQLELVDTDPLIPEMKIK